MERKTLKIEDVNFWNNATTYCFAAIIVCGILLGLITITTGIIPTDSNRISKAGSFEFIVFCAFAIFCIILGLIVMWLGLEDNPCYYCKKKITNINKRIIVEWPEQTKYYDKETVIREAMHLKCHKKAENKFRIPDPKFSSVEI